MKKISFRTMGWTLTVLLAGLTAAADARADESTQVQWRAESEAAAASSDASLGQYPRAEMTRMTDGPVEPQSLDFPKVQNAHDEQMANRFSWWPTDARPAPVKDEYRSGYWWWPEVPGEQRPWGNRGFVYVRKIIFDYKSSEGEMKPSLVIKKVLKNVKILFDFDKSDLRDDARSILADAVRTLEQNPRADILITGNADVRGSEQYNKKLGERRAESVRVYMADRGVAAERVRILSRGKLDAMAPSHDLVGMQKDRNAQFMIAEVEEVMIPASKAHLFEDKVIEEREEVESEVRVDTKDYVIQPGDTLWGIAVREYGNGNQWKRIYEFNKDVIADPNRPRRGTKIRIPIE